MKVELTETLDGIGGGFPNVSENPHYSDLLELCHHRRRPHTRCIVWPGGRISVSLSAFESFWTWLNRQQRSARPRQQTHFFTSFLRCVSALCLLMAVHSCGSSSIKTPPSSVSNGEAVLAASNHSPAVGARRTACAPPEAADYGGGGGNDRLV